MDYDARDQVFSNRLVYESGNFAQQLRVFLDSLSQSHLLRQAKDYVPVLDVRENLRQVQSAGLGLTGETRGTNPSLASERNAKLHVAGVTAKKRYAEIWVTAPTEIEKCIRSLRSQASVCFTVPSLVAGNKSVVVIDNHPPERTLERLSRSVPAGTRLGRREGQGNGQYSWVTPENGPGLCRRVTHIIALKLEQRVSTK